MSIFARGAGVRGVWIGERSGATHVLSFLDAQIGSSNASHLLTGSGYGYKDMNKECKIELYNYIYLDETGYTYILS